MRLALFGGSFDPFHLAHLSLAQIAIKSGKVDEVVFLPAALSPHKLDSEPSSGSVRCQMIERSIRGEKGMRVDLYDLDAPPPSYSIRTAEHFRESYPDADLFWIMGSDQWNSLDSWYEHEKLASLVTFLVFPRPSCPEPKKGVRLETLDHRFDVSSSEIREAVKNGEELIGKLPHPVIEIIQMEGLYGSSVSADG